jgi:Selenocysteine synthase [seryl-tRNASer selenium transferase]
MPNRRRFLQGLSSLPLMTTPSLAAPVKRDYFKELGVRPFINAAGTYTTLTASLMQPEVVQAIDYASKQFVHLDRLARRGRQADRFADRLRSGHGNGGRGQRIDARHGPPA